MSLREPELTGVAEFLTPVLRTLKAGFVVNLGLPPPAALDLDSIRSWLAGLDGRGLRRVLDEFRDSPVIERVRTSLARDSIATTSTHEAFGYPVVDRDALLRYIRMLHSGEKKVLYVRGGRFGKTHSKLIVKREVQRYRARFAEVDLLGAPTLAAVFDGFAANFHPRPEPPAHATGSTEDHWAGTCARFVFTCASASAAAPMWLVFDHFDKSFPELPVTAFFAKLVHHAETQESTPSALKLVLIDHAEVVPGPRDGVIIDHVDKPDEDDLARYYRTKYPAWTPERAAAEAVDDLTALAAVPDDEWMSRLRARLR